MKRGATFQAIEAEVERKCGNLKTRIPSSTQPGLLGEAEAQLAINNELIDKLTRELRFYRVGLLAVTAALLVLPGPLRRLGRTTAAIEARIAPIIIEGTAVRIANTSLLAEIRLTRVLQGSLGRL